MAAACFPPLMPIVLIKPQIALPIRDYAHHTFRHLSLHRCIPGKSVTLSRMASGLDFSDWQLSAVLSVGNGAGTTLVPSITGLAQQRCTTISHCVSLTSAIFLRRIRSLANSENPERNHSDVHRFVGAYIWKLNHPTMTPTEVGTVSVMFFFLPAAVIIVRRFPIRRGV